MAREERSLRGEQLNDAEHARELATLRQGATAAVVERDRLATPAQAPGAPALDPERPVVVLVVRGERGVERDLAERLRADQCGRPR